MGLYQITHVRVSDNNATSVEKITDVRLAGNYKDCTVAEIIKYIEGNNEFFYTTAHTTTKSIVEVATSALGNKYIRTKANGTKQDNLLSLPRF
ncbi:DUF3892 domain-containing protein [Lactococcus petauri]|uniref:DUF3892 domain-containing protein n=1 Tax=Lactococcus petauri TaxID=1940789 RepID=UPI0038551C8A